MKIISYITVLVVSLVASSKLSAQSCLEGQAINYLEGNNIRAAFRTGGDMFSDGISASFTTPNDSFSTIYAGALWLGGYDSGGNLKLAAQTYRSSGNDYWPGPIPNGGGSPDCSNFDKIWKVKNTPVKALIDDYTDNNIIDSIPDSTLLAWPGKGNPHFLALNGFSIPNQDLAPFYDNNNDGIYNPYDGDYPVADPLHPTVIADDLLWLVFNDIGNLHTQTNGLQLGVEVQLTAYAFDCRNSPLISQTIFIKHKIINKSVLPIYDFVAGLWTDFDLGCASDDFFGSAPSLNTIYAYNGDNLDDSYCFASPANKGYLTNPPVQAVTLLNKSIKHSMHNINSSSSPQGGPSSAVAYYRVLTGVWADSTPLTYGGNGYAPTSTNTTDFAFPDNPNDATGWSMQTAGLTPLDIRGLITADTNVLLSGGIYEMVSAYSFHRDLDSNNLQNVNLMYQQIPIVQQYYDDGYILNNTCNNSYTGTNTLSINQQQNASNIVVDIYPNPTTGGITLEATDEIIEVQIFNTLGKNVYSQVGMNDYQIHLNLNQLPQGIYLVQTKTRQGLMTNKIQRYN